jgi:hypothetical protein
MPRKDIGDVKVRVGAPEDVEGVMQLALMVCKENGIFDPNVNKIMYDIWPSLHRDHGMVGVIGKPGEPLEGFVLLRIGTMWYSDAEIIEEKTVFVHPDFRGAAGGRARKLCEFSKKVSDELELPLIIGVLSNTRTQSKVRMYERIFGKPAGAFFIYGAQTGNWWAQQAAE